MIELHCTYKMLTATNCTKMYTATQWRDCDLYNENDNIGCLEWFNDSFCLSTL